MNMNKSSLHCDNEMKNSTLRSLCLAVLAVMICTSFSFFTAGCWTIDRTKVRGEVHSVQFYVETSKFEPSSRSKTLKMHRSLEEIPVENKPIIRPVDIQTVNLVQFSYVEGGDGNPEVLFEFQLTPDASRRLYILTSYTRGHGRRVVMTMDGNPIGCMRIYYPVKDGKWRTRAELSRQEKDEMCLKMRESFKKIQKSVRGL